MIIRPHMQKVRARNTTPELTLRKMIWSMGYRGYRVHYSSLPGKPDIAFPGRKKVIFVHGCFWHGHGCRAGRNTPRSNQEYWLPKLERNRTRDKRNARKIRGQGWGVLTVWECQLKDAERVERRIARFLN